MDLSTKNKLVLNESKSWIEKFVIGLNICPFAGPSFQQNKIDYKIIEVLEHVPIIESFLSMLSSLVAKPEISNSFLILPKVEDFENYLDLYYTFEDLIKESATDQYFQLASFHPKYQYEGLEYDDHANFRNRSPYPMIHILRVSEVEKAIELHENTLEIPAINEAKLRAMTKDDLMNMLNSISKSYE